MIDDNQEQAGLAWQVGVWNEISDVYLSEIDLRFRPVVEATIKEARPIAGKNVLDLGTGTGAVAQQAAPIVGPSGRVVAVSPRLTLVLLVAGLAAWTCEPGHAQSPSCAMDRSRSHSWTSPRSVRPAACFGRGACGSSAPPTKVEPSRAHRYVAAGIDGPAVVPGDTGFRLVLPPEMVDAVETLVPAFRMNTIGSYSRCIREGFAFTSRQAPWAVVGDFDGNGRSDVVIDGSVASRCYRLCIWGGTDVVVEILRVSDTDGCAEELGEVLLFVPPGDRRTNFSDQSVFLFFDAYDAYIWEKGGATWYWKGGRWNEWYSSD